MRLLICGSRYFNDYAVVRKAVSQLPRPPLVIIHGNCRGADQLGGRVAVDLGIPVLVYHADWDRHGKSAGPKRNQRMLDEGRPDLVLAFLATYCESRGTRDMIAKAKRAGVEVRAVEVGNEVP
jgi:hypothetical protein